MVLLSEDHERAEAIVNEIYAEGSESLGISGDLVSAVSALSEDSAERVRLLLGETPSEARARLAEFLERRARPQ